jgi:hypothetical protein
MKFFYALGELTSDIAESLGTGVYKSSSNIFRAAQRANSSRVALLFLIKYFGILFQSSTLLTSFVVKAIFSVIGDVLTTVWSIVRGLIQVNKHQLAKAIMLPFHSLNGHLLVFFGYVVVVIQKLFFIQRSDRSFTEKESEVLNDLFDDSLAIYNVRMVVGRSGLFHINGRPFVLGNFVFMKDVSMHRGLPVLIHECVHVWQYQRFGARYASEALYAQWTMPNAYDWRTEKKMDSNWFNWNREAQASFIEEMWGKYKIDEELIDGNTFMENTIKGGDENFSFFQEIIAKIKLSSSNRIV